KARVIGEIAPIGCDGICCSAPFGAHHLEERADEMGTHCPGVPLAGALVTFGVGRPPGRIGSGSPSRSRVGMRTVTGLGSGSTNETRANIPAKARPPRNSTVMKSRKRVGIEILLGRSGRNLAAKGFHPVWDSLAQNQCCDQHQQLIGPHTFLTVGARTG